MRVRIDTVTLATHRPREVARFWRDFLGYTVAPNGTASVLLVSPDGGPSLLVQPSPHPVSRGAIHFDLRPEDQAAARRRALELGASDAEVGQTGREGWHVMADPGGNLFCLLRSERENLAALAAVPASPTPID